jgi:hypothetical protein
VAAVVKFALSVPPTALILYSLVYGVGFCLLKRQNAGGEYMLVAGIVLLA